MRIGTPCHSYKGHENLDRSEHQKQHEEYFARPELRRGRISAKGALSKGIDRKADAKSQQQNYLIGPDKVTDFGSAEPSNHGQHLQMLLQRRYESTLCGNVFGLAAAGELTFY